MKSSIVFIIFFVAAGAAQAQINKCVDAAGKTVYSQGPCPKGVKSSTVATSPAAASVPAGASKSGEAANTGGPKTAAELDQEFRKRQQEQADGRKKEDERIAQLKNDQENCEAARRQLAGFELGGRQSSINDKGERIFLEDAQIEQQKQRARQVVASACK